MIFERQRDVWLRRSDENGMQNAFSLLEIGLSKLRRATIEQWHMNNEQKKAELNKRQ